MQLLNSKIRSESAANIMTHEQISNEVITEAFKRVDQLAELEKRLDNLTKNVNEIEKNLQEEKKESKLRSKVKLIIHDLLLNIYINGHS